MTKPQWPSKLPPGVPHPNHRQFEELRAENERLKETLRWIRDASLDGEVSSGEEVLAWLGGVARAALRKDV